MRAQVSPPGPRVPTCVDAMTGGRAALLDGLGVRLRDGEREAESAGLLVLDRETLGERDVLCGVIACRYTAPCDALTPGAPTAREAPSPESVME